MIGGTILPRSESWESRFRNIIMDDSKWQTISIQSIILTSSIAFLLFGENNSLLVISASIILFLFLLQALSSNVQFLYLFPASLPKKSKKISWETWFLRTSIVLAIFFLFLGATGLLFHRLYF